MREKGLVGASVLALTLISFFHFPGHTILQSDTQIYLPILEHLWDPEVLTRDIVAINPHVSFTVYDEVAITLRKLTGAGFESVLMGQQFVYRAVGILGLVLVGTGIGLSTPMALLLTAVVSLGATITGPAVLTLEYEPVPRGFAMPFLLLALGLIANKRWRFAAVSAGVGFLFHPPTALAFCAVFAMVAIGRRDYRTVGILAGAAALMAIFITTQAGISYDQHLLGQVDPALEKLQRMRASYNWVSLWIGNWWMHYLLLWAISIAALYRVKETLTREMQIFCVALPMIGLISLPASYQLLEKWKWILTPQFQPARYLLYVTLFAVLLAVAAAIRAGQQKRYLESFLFFVAGFAVPTVSNLFQLTTSARVMVILILATVALAAVRWPLLTVAAALLPFFLIPILGKVRNYPPAHSAELNALSHWAKTSTPKEALFQFADAGQGQDPGIFRARALRAIYVDWKGGGQVNFLRAFASEWWRRWLLVEKVLPLEEYRALRIDYVVFQKANRLQGMQPVYENARYLVYKD